MKNIWKLSGALSVVAVGLAGCGGGNNGGLIGGTPATATYTQQERLGRPLINEVFATVAQNRHQVNNTDNPSDDAGQLKSDITSFMTFPAGRSAATTNAVTSVLVPDLMKADLSQAGPAAYLGVETGGVTGGKFGGRKLQDDVVDMSLGVIFGNTVSALGLAPDDGKESPALTSDNVDSSGHQYSATFPYLQAPH